MLPGIHRKINIGGSNKSMYYSYGADTEIAIINEFRQHAIRFLDKKDLDTIDIIGFAQHHFAPTRLLDMTSNPLVALYFSCVENDGKDGAVWLIDSNLYYLASMPNHNEKITKLADVLNIYLDKYDSTIKKNMPIIYISHYLDTRMSTQSSIFLMWGDRKLSLEEIISKEDCISVNSISENDKDRKLISYCDFNNEPLMYKFIVNKQKKKHILRELDMLGINEMSLFPGLDGVGRYIRSKYLLNEKEAKHAVAKMK